MRTTICARFLVVFLLITVYLAFPANALTTAGKGEFCSLTHTQEYVRATCGSGLVCANRDSDHFAGICMPTTITAGTINLNSKNAWDGDICTGSYIEYASSNGQSLFNNKYPSKTWSRITWSGYFCGVTVYQTTLLKTDLGGTSTSIAAYLFKATDETKYWFGYQNDDTPALPGDCLATPMTNVLDYAICNVKPLSNGGSCVKDYHCSSGHCQNGVCCAAGKTCCKYSSDCASGYQCGSSNYCVVASTTTTTVGATTTTTYSTTTTTTGSATTTTNPCQSKYSCSDCTSASSCGWCKNLGACKKGSSTGPSDSSCSSANWAWSGSDCAATTTTTYGTTTTTAAPPSTGKSDGESCNSNSECDSMNCNYLGAENFAEGKGVCCAYGKYCCKDVGYTITTASGAVYECSSSHYLVYQSSGATTTTYQTTTTISSDTCTYSNCDECAPKPNCKWCSTGGCAVLGTGACSGEWIYGLSSCPASSATTTAPTSTTAPSCGSQTSCSACTATSGCGWCLNSGPCKGGISSGSTDSACADPNWAWFSSECYATTTTQMKKQSGETCASNNECQSGNCLNKVCCKENMRCCKEHSQCQAQEFCGYANYCENKKDNGQPCNRHADCKSNRCDTSRDMCVAQETVKGIGEECRLTSDCETGLSCKYAKLGGKLYCCPQGNAYCCATDLDCTKDRALKDYYCVGGNDPKTEKRFSCQPYPEAHQYVAKQLSPSSLLKQVGYACMNDAQCMSNHCSNSICCASGRCCTMNADCASGEACNYVLHSCVKSESKDTGAIEGMMIEKRTAGKIINSSALDAELNADFYVRTTGKEGTGVVGKKATAFLIITNKGYDTFYIKVKIDKLSAVNNENYWITNSEPLPSDESLLGTLSPMNWWYRTLHELRRWSWQALQLVVADDKGFLKIPGGTLVVAVYEFEPTIASAYNVTASVSYYKKISDEYVMYDAQSGTYTVIQKTGTPAVKTTEFSRAITVREKKCGLLGWVCN